MCESERVTGQSGSVRSSSFPCMLQEMEIEVVKHWELLQAMFKLYKAKDRTKMFWIEHWIALLDSTKLLGGWTGKHKCQIESTCMCVQRRIGCDHSKGQEMRCVLALLHNYDVCVWYLRTGVDKYCSKVIFGFAQGTVADELKRRQRAVSLMFFDFVEVSEALSVSHTCST